MKMVSTWMIIMTGAAVLGSGAAGSGQRPPATGDRLKPCPDSPNCVSSLSSDPRHRVAPMAFTGSPAGARERLWGVIRSMPRARIRSHEGPCLQVEFTSAVFRFVDDVEFCIDEAEKLIHVRSASRVGYWDLGANRRRVEEIRRRMTKALTEETGP
jgi:uncharacterized protein (DUF1499 family)